MSLIYLLDSNIVSEPTKPSPSQLVFDRLEKCTSNCSVSSVTLYEVVFGVLKMDDGNRKRRLMAYYQDLIFNKYVNQILPYDEKAAMINAHFDSVLRKRGYVTSTRDAMIAATALANNLTLVTRNIKDFKFIQEVTDLKIENWFEI